MAVKIIGCVLLVIATTLVGFIKSHKLYSRRDTLLSFGVFLNSLSTNIRYNSSDIVSLVSMCNDDFSRMIVNNLSDVNVAFSERWNNAVDKLPISCSLNQKDKEIMHSFGEKLGVTDVEGQIKHIELYQQIALGQVENADKEISDKSKLYRTMGFFAGTAAALVLI